MAKYIYPVREYLTITQGFKSSHVGHDYGWRSGYSNQPIVAIADGTVVAVVDGWGNTYPSNRIYGNYVIVKHGGGVYSLYGHLAKGVYVVKGQVVKQGQVLGYMGNTGYSMGQHLHFEYRAGGNSKAYAQDPLKYLECPATVKISDSSLYRSQIRVAQSGIGTPVARDVTRDQIEVCINNLNARNNASVNADRLGYMTEGIYNVNLEQMGGDYKWYEVEPDVWIASSEGKWTKFMPKEAKPKLYLATVGPMTGGDKDAVVKLADERSLPCEVKEAI